DGNKALGNLYRTVTDEGHVKWVCIDHYRTNYQENAAKEFERVLESVGGTFKEDVGKVCVRLKSRLLAEQFFSVLGKARSVYELDIDFDWACSTSDLEALEYALKTSRVSILQMYLLSFRTSVASKLLSVAAQYDVLFRIRDLPNMKRLHIVHSVEHIKFVRSAQKQATHACKMSYGLIMNAIGEKELRLVSETLKTNSTLTILSLSNNLIGANGSKALAEALRTNSTLITLILWASECEGDGVEALAEALKTNSTLTTLQLSGNRIGTHGDKALDEALKTNSAVTITKPFSTLD
ncbi:hypothetical protein BGZ72_002312, partial [Mortierella alpina]